MNALRAARAAVVGCVALAGCHVGLPGGGKAKAPTGQVVAIVGNREVTIRDLNAELGSAAFPDSKTRKAAEELALRNIVGRIVLADAARARGLDKTPDFAIRKQRAIDSVLAETLQQQIASDVPPPSKDEVQSFITANPDIFIERKIFSVDQIRMGRPDPAIIKSLEPLTTLDDVEAALKKYNVAYRRVAGSLDAVGVEPTIIQRIVKLPPGEVFVIPSGDGLLVNQIRDSRIEPFTGQAAFAYAQKLLTRQRTQEAVTRTYMQIMAKARDEVRFNKDYAPASAPAPAANPAPAKAP